MDEKEVFYNGWFDGLLEPNQGIKNETYESLVKLLNLLDIKEANKLSIFINKLLNTPEAKGYFDTKTLIYKKIQKWVTEQKENKRKELNEIDSKQLSEKDKESVLKTYEKSLKVPEEFNNEIIELTNTIINSEEFVFEKYRLKGNLIKTYKVPDLKELESLDEKSIENFSKLIEKIQTIDSWNLKGTDIKNLNRYIDFIFEE